MNSINFEDFSEYLQPRLPWMQVLNPPNLNSLKMIEEQPYGFFITLDNLSLIGASNEQAEEMGWKLIEQQFRGEESVIGYVTKKLKFVTLYQTPTIVESKESGFIDFLFAKGTNSLSSAGESSKTDPGLKRKSWWLILLIDQENQIVGSPIKLSLSNASGAALTQELKKNVEETEINFFRAVNKPVQGLSEAAKRLFIYNWTIGACKVKNLAPYAVVTERLGLIPELATITRYSNGPSSRSVTISPCDISEAVFSPKSSQGIKIAEYAETCKDQFFASFNTRTKTEVVEPVALVETEIVSEPLIPVNNNHALADLEYQPF